MAWIDEAEKYTTLPVILFEIDFSATDTRKYSIDYIRPVGSAQYKGNVLSVPRIYQSVGDIKRAYEISRIEIIFSDTDRELKILAENQALKNKAVRISLTFPNRSLATESLPIFTGWIYDYELLSSMNFRIICQNVMPNLDNKYPNKRVTYGDYPNAPNESLDWIIPIPYGVISDSGLRNKGAFGHPSLSSNNLGTGLIFVDDTQDAEIHLVGRQTGAITVDRVYIDGVLKTEGVGNDYQISTQVIDGFTHTEIHWNAGVRPTILSFVSCDITFGSWTPVEMIRDFLENFCDYDTAWFDATSYATAIAKESTRGYSADGALWEDDIILQTILDIWRDEFELEIFVNKSGLIEFNYISSVIGTPNTYTDALDIHPPFNMKRRPDELLNKIVFGYFFNYANTYYYKNPTYSDAGSYAKYENTWFEKFKGFRWIRSDTMARDIASRKVIRFKDPITFYYLKLPLRSFNEDLADVVKITHFEGVGTNGIIDKFCQIRSFEFDLDKMINSVVLEDASNFFGKSCILGDMLILPALWTAASGSERDYCYLCDLATGEFSDGEPGKKLFD